MRPRRLSIAALVLCALPAAQGQSDLAKIAEGRVAYDKYHDCRAALQAFESVTEEGRSPVWVIYMARTEECLGKLDEAARHYEQYDRLVPNQAEVLQKIGELRYLVKKHKEEAQRAEEQRRNAEAMRRDAEVMSDARRQRAQSALRDLPAKAEQLKTLLSKSEPATAGFGPYGAAATNSLLSYDECTVVFRAAVHRRHADKNYGPDIDGYREFRLTLRELGPSDLMLFEPSESRKPFEIPLDGKPGVSVHEDLTWVDYDLKGKRQKPSNVSRDTKHDSEQRVTFTGRKEAQAVLDFLTSAAQTCRAAGQN